MVSCCSLLVAVWRGTDKCSQPCRASQLTVASCLPASLSLDGRRSCDRQPALSLVDPAHVIRFLLLIGRFCREFAVNHPATARQSEGNMCSTATFLSLLLAPGRAALGPAASPQTGSTQNNTLRCCSFYLLFFIIVVLQTIFLSIFSPYLARSGRDVFECSKKVEEEAAYSYRQL